MNTNQPYHMGRVAFWRGIPKWRKDNNFVRTLGMLHFTERIQMIRAWKAGWRDAARGM